MSAVRLSPGQHYRQSRARLVDMVAPLGDTEWSLPVPACPGWRVRDVVAHLAATTEDALAGRLTGPPEPAQTAGQVSRMRAVAPRDMVALLERDAPAFEEMVDAFKIWPAAFDMVSHEHDIRGAIGRPGARDHMSVDALVRLLLRNAELGATVEFDLGDGDPIVVGQPPATLTLRTTPFELFRLRMGRRSRDQIAALDWSADPGPVLDRLCVFGPAAVPVIE